MGLIYRLICHKTNNVYFGSTFVNLKRRLERHEEQYRLFKLGYYRGKMASYLILESGDYEIELVEDLGHCDKTTLLWRERYYIDTFNCVNKNRPIQTDDEKRNHGKRIVLSKIDFIKS